MDGKRISAGAEYQAELYDSAAAVFDLDLENYDAFIMAASVH
jgi:menaquinone-dependent protoporphyrinogen IX oxidase